MGGGSDCDYACHAGWFGRAGGRAGQAAGGERTRGSSGTLGGRLGRRWLRHSPFDWLPGAGGASPATTTRRQPPRSGPVLRLGPNLRGSATRARGKSGRGHASLLRCAPYHDTFRRMSQKSGVGHRYCFQLTVCFINPPSPAPAFPSLPLPLNYARNTHHRARGCDEARLWREPGKVYCDTTIPIPFSPPLAPRLADLRFTGEHAPGCSH